MDRPERVVQGGTCTIWLYIIASEASLYFSVCSCQSRFMGYALEY